MNDAILVIRLPEETKQKLLKYSGGNISEAIRLMIEKFIEEKEIENEQGS